MRVVVVGAGVLGASVAYHLATAGAEVTVVDEAHEGRATAAGAGIICPWLSDTGDAAFTALYTGGARYYPALVEALGGAESLGYRRSGALFVSRDPAELAAVEAAARRWTGRAPEIGAIERLTPAEARGLFPPLARDRRRCASAAARGWTGAGSPRRCSMRRRCRGRGWSGAARSWPAPPRG